MSVEGDHDQLIEARIAIARLEVEVKSAKEALVLADRKVHSMWGIVLTVALIAVGLLGVLIHSLK